MKRIIAAISTAATLATSATAATALHVVTNRDTGGGDIAKHYNRVQELNKAGVSVRIESNVVSSAGTFYLLADNVCVANPRAMFEFHGPQHTATAWLVSAITIVPLPVSFMGKERAEEIRRQIAWEYNQRWPGLGDWYYWNASHKAGMRVTKVRASELNRAFGVPICKEEIK